MLERDVPTPARLAVPGAASALVLAAALAVALAGCEAPAADAGRGSAGDAAPSSPWEGVQDSTARVGVLEGFSAPESVRYDPEQDVWFVGNMAGDGNLRDANGFISRVRAESGAVESLRFAQGTPERPLHAPRGMVLVGDTLWVADADGVHGFDRRTGASLAFVNLSRFEPGFLNDVAHGPDGALYVTDTRKSAVYRIAGREASVALADTALGNPNGIAWDETRGILLLVPWTAGFRVTAWRPGSMGLEPLGPTVTPGGLDGVEPFARRFLVASQTDSTIVLMDAGGGRPLIRTPGRPADIGVDTRRRRVAVPYVALDRVDVWALPER
jgi:hypothetical protein